MTRGPNGLHCLLLGLAAFPLGSTGSHQVPRGDVGFRGKESLLLSSSPHPLLTTKGSHKRSRNKYVLKHYPPFPAVAQRRKKEPHSPSTWRRCFPFYVSCNLHNSPCRDNGSHLCLRSQDWDVVELGFKHQTQRPSRGRGAGKCYFCGL